MRAAVATVRRYVRELGDEPAVVLCGATALLIISHYQGSTGFFGRVFPSMFKHHPAAAVLPFFWWFAVSLVLFLVVPLALSYATGGSFTRAYGFGLGDWRAGLKITLLFLAVMMPAAWWAASSQAFKGTYPLAGQAAYTLEVGGKDVVSVGLFLVYEVGYLLYFIGWEFLFRGWMLNGLLPRLGRGGALLAQMSPFAVMHLGKPEVEALGSIAAGLALGILALRTRSFWYGALIHGVIALWMDVLSSWNYLFPSPGPG